MTRQTSAESDECEMWALNDCLHYFCIDCWRQHFESLINFGAFLTSTLECMQTKCNTIASKEFVLKCLNFKSKSRENTTDGSSLKYKNYPERYKQMVGADLVKESEDLQMCPGDSIISHVGINPYSATPLTPLAKASAIASVANIASAMSMTSATSTFSGSPKSTSSSSLYKYPTSSSYATPSLFSTLFSSKLNIGAAPSESSPLGNNNHSSLTKKCNYVVWAKSKPAARRVVCSYCTTQYCFLCSSPYHAPNGN